MSTWMKSPRGGKPIWTGWAGAYETRQGKVLVQAAVEADGSFNLHYRFENDTGKEYHKAPVDKFPDGYTFGFRNAKTSGAVNVGRKLSQRIALDAMAVLANGMLVEKAGG